jgi:hypothetical protein
MQRPKLHFSFNRTDLMQNINNTGLRGIYVWSMWNAGIEKPELSALRCIANKTCSLQIFNRERTNKKFPSQLLPLSRISESKFLCSSRFFPFGQKVLFSYIIIIIIIIIIITLFNVCSSCKNYPSARCASVANVVCRDVDVFGARNVLLSRLL